MGEWQCIMNGEMTRTCQALSSSPISRSGHQGIALHMEQTDASMPWPYLHIVEKGWPRLINGSPNGQTGVAAAFPCGGIWRQQAFRIPLRRFALAQRKYF
jgi:hypothetical protein